MAEEGHKFSGAERAAILLMSMGEEHAARVLRRMGPRQVQKVGSAMSSLKNISSEQINGVVREFLNQVQGQGTIQVGGENYVRKVLTQAFGDDNADTVINRVLDGTGSRGLEALQWMDAITVAEAIRKEHPQIIATVLSQLDADQAAGVLLELPEERRADLLVRVARIETIPPAALSELDSILKNRLSSTSSPKSSTAGGPKAVADILNFVGNEAEGSITESITAVDAELAQQIQELMFVFDNLKDVDDRGMQALLREVSSDVLVVALKGADESIKNKIFSNMSKRAGELLRDDLETKGPVKLSEVEAAQKEILAVVQRMAESGDLILGGKGGEEYV
jgi:flagellar motor switch protein FliG